VLEVRVAGFGDLDRIVGLLSGLGSAPPVADAHAQRVTLPTNDRVATLLAAARRIDESHIEVEDLSLRRPSLDDVFLTLTSGRAPELPRPAATPPAHPTNGQVAA
jgi:hypothetical protein